MADATPCRSCGARLPLHARYCGSCGHPIAVEVAHVSSAPAAVPERPRSRASALEIARRQRADAEAEKLRLEAKTLKLQAQKLREQNKHLRKTRARRKRQSSKTGWLIVIFLMLWICWMNRGC
jgi:hypothetical protein